MIFLDTNHDWILARDRQELTDALLERIDALLSRIDDDHLLQLPAACLGCKEANVIMSKTA